MKMPIVAAAAVVVFAVAVSLALGFVLLMALNGYSAADANAALWLFGVGSGVTALLAACGAYFMTGRLASRGRGPLVAVSVAVVPLMFLLATAEVVLVFSGVIMAENARKAKIELRTDDGK